MKHHWPILIALAALLFASCQTLPPPDPVTMEEIMALGAEGPENPALLEALRTRPLAFPLSYGNLKELESRGASPALIDTVVSYTVDRRARALAPTFMTYDPWYYGPGYCGPWRPYYGPHWRFGFGYGYNWCCR